jgi:hypothetical protein
MGDAANPWFTGMALLNFRSVFVDAIQMATEIMKSTWPKILGCGVCGTL